MRDNAKGRVVLEGVPRVGYDRHLCPFPGSLLSCLQYLGTPCDYDYIMGVTGAAFRRFWNRDDGGNIDLFYLGEEPARRIFAALGYEWQHVPPEKPLLIDSIRASVQRGVPVIAFGVVGPPEAGLVTGYEQDGEVLVGWSYFQESREAYYEKAGWFETMQAGPHANCGALIVGKQQPGRPEARSVYLDALRWAVELECSPTWPGVPDHIAGLAAYQAWANALEVDSDYPADDPAILQLRAMVQADQAVMVEERGRAASFLRQAAEELPESFTELSAAAVLYEQVRGLVSRVWPWGESMGPETQTGLSQPRTRWEIAQAVREAGRLEAEAVTRLQEALSVAGVRA